ncbi:amidase [Achromobacter spanius]|uniref:Amidase n=1 Tax=Achromobacter spanius TaxID=217203 RepID=A0AAW3HYY7_9BURK|nr:amidase [Achromobacter spanius]KNE25769.1 amidase [Achromobacter spanius]
MRDTEYQALDGLALADLLARREVSPEDLMACAIKLAQERAPAMNALCYERYEESLDVARAWQARGVFGAIPFLLKDSGLAHTRFPSSLGSRLLNDTRYARNATLADRFEAAGLIPFARTTVPEFCMAPTTEAARNGGPTRNPWDPTRSTGGSSGGAAAAVAAGIVPLAHGSDGGGSIRIPAAACGVYGLKVSRGRVPMGPLRGEGWGGLATDGVLSRSVRDTAAALDAISAPEPGAPYAAPAAPGAYLDLLAKPPRKMRIVVWRSAFNGVAVAPECVAAVERAAALCRELGHEVVDGTPPDIEYDAFVQAHANVLAGNIVLSVDTRLGLTGQPLADDDLEPVLRQGYEYGKSLPAAQYIGSVNRFHAIGRILDSYMQGYDAILSPSLTQLPLKLGELSTAHGSFLDFRRKVATYGTFSAAFNASGQPAASLPLVWTDAGLPVGVQVVGRYGDEAVVLALSAQLETAQPWAGRIAVPHAV